MLFSEPKISQFGDQSDCVDADPEFQCSSASRKFLNSRARRDGVHRNDGFQCSSASRKFLNRVCAAFVVENEVFQCSSASRKFLNRALDGRFIVHRRRVSVLFSEPKISQSSGAGALAMRSARFSALQRAENFSIVVAAKRRPVAARFSALQRAENFSIFGFCQSFAHSRAFQCSSASRKFLNNKCDFPHRRPARVSVLFSEPKISQSRAVSAPALHNRSFSALQRAENFSIGSLRCSTSAGCNVSVLFSEPKISQSSGSQRLRNGHQVSVLFSEPKISQ